MGISAKEAIMLPQMKKMSSNKNPSRKDIEAFLKKYSFLFTAVHLLEPPNHKPIRVSNFYKIHFKRNMEELLVNL